MRFEEAWKEWSELKEKVRKKECREPAQVSIDSMMVAMIMQHEIEIN